MSSQPKAIYSVLEKNLEDDPDDDASGPSVGPGLVGVEEQSSSVSDPRPPFLGGGGLGRVKSRKKRRSQSQMWFVDGPGKDQLRFGGHGWWHPRSLSRIHHPWSPFSNTFCRARANSHTRS